MIINANILDGEGCFLNIEDTLSEYGYKKAIYLVDENLFKSSKYVSKVLNNITDKNQLIFYDYLFEPSYQMLDRLMIELNEKKIFTDTDVIVAIGGGSVMDTAKGLAILAKNRGESINYKGFPTALNEPLPVIAIPSTTGTGSEVVFNASFIDEDSKVKMGINYNKNYPVLAILDPVIPSTAPKSVLCSSGCDALVHCLEGFMSKNSNTHARYFSKKSYELIMKNMVPLLEDRGDLSNWINMQWAAVYAMFSLSNSTSGPTGALSYYLGTNYKVNHGIAGGVFIGKVTRYNHEKGYMGLSELYFGQDKQLLDSETKSEMVVEEINHLLALASIPEKLSIFGVNQNNVEGFNDFANVAKAAFDFNPVPINTSKVSDLFIML